MMQRLYAKFLASLLLTFISAVGGVAGEMRSVQAEVAILYDAPSAKAKKLYLVRKTTPLEVIVNLDGMSKVRDAEGSLAWIDKTLLSETRTVVVVATQTDMRQSAGQDSPLVTSVEKWVCLDLLELPIGGWAKVRHRDGATGYVRQQQVWGI